MALHLRGSLPWLSLALVAACGSPPPAATPAPPPKPQPMFNDPPVDVSPLPEPNNLVVLARINRPEGLIKTVADWTHLPLPGGRDLLRQVNETLSDIVDLGQPVDAAVGVTLSRHGVDPIYAVSVGIKNFNEAKARIAQRHKMVPVTNGAFKIYGLVDKGNRAEVSEDEDDDREVCVLAHAATAAKLVCGPGEGVDNLTPYMTRTMPRETWKSDFHLEVRPEPVRGPLTEMRGALPMLARSLTGSSSQALRELVDASVGEAVDLVQDAQKLTIDATINDTGVDATSRFDFQSTKSVVARALTDVGRADVAPPAFWHLPSDTDTAFFTRGSDPTLYDHPREILTNLLTEGMESAQLPTAEQKLVRDLVAEKMLRLFTNGGLGVYAKGFDQDALEKAIKARRSVKPDDFAGDAAAGRAITEQVIGWHLYQVSEPIAKVGPILKDWSSVWARPALSKWFEQKTHTPAKELPKLRITPVPAGVTLPKDTVHLEVTVPVAEATAPPTRGQKAPAKPIPQKPMVVHILAVPDGSATWLGLGLDVKLLGAKAAQSRASAPDANTLGKSVQGVALLKEPKLNGGGLFTMRGLAVLTAMDAGRAGGEPEPYEILGGLPGKGATPIVFTGKAEASGNTRSSVGQFVMPRAAIEDIFKLAVSKR